MRSISLLFLLTLSSLTSLACAQFQPGMIVKGEAPDQAVSIEQLVEKIPRGSIIIFSEIHNLVDHHQNHDTFLRQLYRDRKLPLIVALEFLDFTVQNYVEQYRLGEISSEEFKELTGFGPNFPWYDQKMQLAFESDGQVIAANAPRTLSSQIARQGLSSLSHEQQLLLPPSFELGSTRYRQRFEDIMSGGGHTLPPDALENYFAAQSLWDDTMAYQLIRARERYPQDDIVLIVGDFHAAYGGGVKDRLIARGVESDEITTISQVQIKGLTDIEVRGLIFPHKQYGVRADYIWLSDSDTFGEHDE